MTEFDETLAAVEQTVNAQGDRLSRIETGLQAAQRRMRRYRMAATAGWITAGLAVGVLLAGVQTCDCTSARRDDRT